MKIPPPQTPEGIRAIAEHVSMIATRDRDKMIAAQAAGYRSIAYLVLTGEADRDPAAFLPKVKHIVRLAGEAGA